MVLCVALARVRAHARAYVCMRVVAPWRAALARVRGGWGWAFPRSGMVRSLGGGLCLLSLRRAPLLVPPAAFSFISFLLPPAGDR